ncbi:MAG: hypothetical protein EPO67_24365 [Reyranella sp.]|jgi:hypothetical protein|nr:MAG: hypothetical protein EPO67_24365 [Reyranella sp.]
MKRPLIAVALVATAFVAAQAHARSPVGAVPPAEQGLADPAGPRSNPTPTAAAAVVRVQAEKSGYTGVRGLTRAADGTWHGTARNAGNAPVAIAIDSQGKVTETR